MNHTTGGGVGNGAGLAATVGLSSTVTWNVSVSRSPAARFASASWAVTVTVRAPLVAAVGVRAADHARLRAGAAVRVRAAGVEHEPRRQAGDGVEDSPVAATRGRDLELGDGAVAEEGLGRHRPAAEARHLVRLRMAPL